MTEIMLVRQGPPPHVNISDNTITEPCSLSVSFSTKGWQRSMGLVFLHGT
jgi:hypothetical protein